jgi:hypothetical protein
MGQKYGKAEKKAVQNVFFRLSVELLTGITTGNISTSFPL